MDGTELASRTGTSADRVAEFAEARVLAPSADGSFDPADINRVRIAESLIAEGFATTSHDCCASTAFRSLRSMVSSPR